MLASVLLPESILSEQGRRERVAGRRPENNAVLADNDERHLAERHRQGGDPKIQVRADRHQVN